VSVNKLDYLLASRSGGYWRLSGGRVQKWRGDQLERDYGVYPWKNTVSSACEDAAGNLVVGTLGRGLYWYQAIGETSSACRPKRDCRTITCCRCVLIARGACGWARTVAG
jgi:hypothetical protein